MLARSQKPVSLRLHIIMLRVIWSLCALLASAGVAYASDFTKIEILETVPANSLWQMHEVSVINSHTDLRMKYWTYNEPWPSYYPGDYIPKMLIMIGGRRNSDPIAVRISTSVTARHTQVRSTRSQEDFLFVITIAEENPCEGCERKDFFIREVDDVLYLNNREIGKL